MLYHQTQSWEGVGGLEGWLFRFCGIFEFHFPLSKISLCHRKDYVCSQSKYLRAHSESTPHSTPVNNQSLIVARLSLASLLSLLHVFSTSVILKPAMSTLIKAFLLLAVMVCISQAQRKFLSLFVLLDDLDSWLKLRKLEFVHVKY